MSKKKAKLKGTVNKKKKDNKLPVIISLAVVAILALGIVLLSIKSCSDYSKVSELYDGTWYASSANNASGDEVELAEVYNINYSSYTGSLSFEKDGRFSLWLSPGNPDDGTHSGTYELNDDKINVVFDEGTETSFIINRSNDEIQSILVYYGDYDVYFCRQ